MVRLVVMAAGQAIRMGTDKLALPWRGSTVLASVLNTVLEAKASLVGQQAVEGTSSGAGTREGLRAALAEGVPEAGCPEAPIPDTGVEIVVVARQEADRYLPPELIQRWEYSGGIWRSDPAPRPLSASVRAGLAGVSSTHSGIAFLPGDQVGITAAGLMAVLREFIRHRPAFLVPLCEGVPVSPAIFRTDYIAELYKLNGEQGGKVVLQRYQELWRVLPVPAGFCDDLDTPAAYERLRNKYGA